MKPPPSILWNVIRLACFAAVVSALGLAIAIHRADAAVERMLFGVGGQLMRFPGAPQRKERVLTLNGLEVHFKVTTVDQNIGDVLNHYEALCEERGSLRRGRGSEAGFVACIELGTDVGLGQLKDRARRVWTTGDLSEMGLLRYVWAKAVDGDGPEQTLLLTLWSDLEVNVHRMFPLDGRDAEGIDLVDVPRPAGSQRILSSWEVGEPYGITMYLVPGQTADELEAHYRQVLPLHGWQLIEMGPAGSVPNSRSRWLAAEKDGRLTTLLLSQEPQEKSVLTVLSSDSL